MRRGREGAVLWTAGRESRPSVCNCSSIERHSIYFNSWVVIDQRNGALLAGELVIIDLIVFGIEQMDLRSEPSSKVLAS
jgi:flagellar basal body P-ring protein FlgI